MVRGGEFRIYISDSYYVVCMYVRKKFKKSVKLMRQERIVKRMGKK